MKFLIVIVSVALILTEIFCNELLEVIDQTSGMPSQSIKCLTIDGSYVVCGFQSGTVMRFNTMSKRWETIPNLSSLPAVPTSICGDNLTLWIGTANGAVKYDKALQKTFSYDTKSNLLNNKINVIRIRSNLVWIGQSGGLSAYNRNTNFINSYSSAHGLLNEEVLCLFPEEDNVWIGTLNGLYCFYPRINRWVSYTTTDGLGDNSIYSIYKDKNILWLGSRGTVTEFNVSTGQKIIYKIDDDESVLAQSIIKIDDKLYIGTDLAGLLEFNCKEKLWRVLDSSNILPYETAAELATDGKDLWAVCASSFRNSVLRLHKRRDDDVKQGNEKITPRIYFRNDNPMRGITDVFFEFNRQKPANFLQSLFAAIKKGDTKSVIANFSRNLKSQDGSLTYASLYEKFLEIFTVPDRTTAFAELDGIDIIYLKDKVKISSETPLIYIYSTVKEDGEETAENPLLKIYNIEIIMEQGSYRIINAG